MCVTWQKTQVSVWVADLTAAVDVALRSCLLLAIVPPNVTAGAAKTRAAIKMLPLLILYPPFIVCSPFIVCPPFAR